MESSNIRLYFGGGNTIFSLTKAYKIVFGGIGAISSINAVLIEQTSGLLIQYSLMITITLLPLIPILLLFAIRSEAKE